MYASSPQGGDIELRSAKWKGCLHMRKYNQHVQEFNQRHSVFHKFRWHHGYGAQQLIFILKLLKGYVLTHFQWHHNI